MSNTVFVRGGSHSASVEQIWGEKTFRQAEKDSFFNDGRFVGTDSNSLIQINTDLTKNKGDMISTPLRARLISDGKVDDTLGRSAGFVNLCMANLFWHNNYCDNIGQTHGSR